MKQEELCRKLTEMIAETKAQKLSCSRKYKHFFGAKAKMIPGDEVERIIGHAIGGVCPFAVNDNVKVYLDESLQRFETVFPAAGSPNSAIELTIPELEKYSNFLQWVDVCKGWQESNTI